MTFIDKWGAALNGRNVGTIVELYGESAVLWGTFSTERRQGHRAIRGYFDGLCRKAELRVRFGEWQQVDLRSATLYSGLYTFSYEEKGEHHSFDARFTFVTVKEGGVERVLEHHSSLVPS